MSEKIKVVQAEPVETVEEKKRNWKGIATGIGIGALAAIAAAVVYSKFADKDDDFDAETVWTPLSDLQENASL